MATASLLQTNQAFHRMLRDGVDVEYPRADGSIKGDQARLLGFAGVDANDWLVVNQFTVTDGQHQWRPDVVVFVNGLPLEVMVRGVFERRRFLDLLQHFIAFEEDPDTGALHKIIAGYHQFHAVNAAVEETVRASGMSEGDQVCEAPGHYWAGRMHGGKPGDRRAGVVWHTQGSGKSLTMLFFAAGITTSAWRRWMARR